MLMERTSDPIDEYLHIDVLALRAHTEEAGDQLDETEHRARLARSFAISEICEVRRRGVVLAYAMLRPKAHGVWFVTAFNVHPNNRTPGVFAALAAEFIAKLQHHGISEIQSNVYRTNIRSMKLHRRLGFIITRENEKGVEFTASAATILTNPVVARIKELSTRRQVSGSIVDNFESLF